MCLIKEILQLIIFHLFSSLDKLIRLAAMTVTTSFLLLLRLIIFYVINLKFLELFQIETNSCFDNFERFFINMANKNLHCIWRLCCFPIERIHSVKLIWKEFLKLHYNLPYVMVCSVHLSSRFIYNNKRN